jgi:CubicO group peptidase (beta-lactamase class C family)
MLTGLAAVLGLIVVAVLPFVLFTPRAPKVPTDIDSIGSLESYLTTLTAHETPPALDVVVIKNGAITYSKTFGVADGPSRRPATADGIYHYWSVTKLFTATAIMQLVEDGKVTLDDPITKYVRTFSATSRSGAPSAITVRQLLDHTSGMKNLTPIHLVGWIHHLDDPPVNQTALVTQRMASYQTLATEPGQAASYSNAGYIVLGAVIESAAGQPYEDFVRERILKPLGMSNTDFIYREDLRARAIMGTHPLFHIFTPLLFLIHRDWFSHWISKIHNYRMWLSPLYTDYTGPTGLVGTGLDLARFGQAFLAGGELEGHRILTTETVRTMLNEGYGANTGPDKDRMGLGWHWWNDAPIPFKGHGGDGPGFGAQLAIFPTQNMVVVVLANDTLMDRIGLTKLVANTFQ